MSFKYCLALALLPCAVGAQAPDPANAQARVPAASYVSAFNNYRSATVQATTPDLAWRDANARVEKEGGHGMHAAMPMPASAEQPATKTDPHAGHAGHQ